VNFSGQGEPLLHKDAAAIITAARSSGLDAALTTNGVYLDAGKREGILGKLSWMRVSLNAAAPATYESVHRPCQMFVHCTQERARSRKYKRGTSSRHHHFPVSSDTGKRARGCGFRKDGKRFGSRLCLDQTELPASVEPFGFHSYFSEKELKSFAEIFRKASTGDFKVIFRLHGFRKSQERSVPYKQCLWAAFFRGDHDQRRCLSCNSFFGNKDFCFGNIGRETFRQIWEGRRRRRIMRVISECGLKYCRMGCRLDEINRYLWDLKNPSGHVNFI
jgi:hypothetical protein